MKSNPMADLVREQQKQDDASKTINWRKLAVYGAIYLVPQVSVFLYLFGKISLVTALILTGSLVAIPALVLVVIAKNKEHRTAAERYLFQSILVTLILVALAQGALHNR